MRGSDQFCMTYNCLEDIRKDDGMTKQVKTPVAIMLQQLNY